MGKVHKFNVYFAFYYYILVAWDLLRICVYGFQSFCEYFLTHYPDRFVSPLWISGSAVETLFNQYKQSASGKLDAADYPIARAVQLIKQTVASHHSSHGYRDLSLDTCTVDLQRKQYGKKGNDTSSSTE